MTTIWFQQAFNDKYGNCFLFCYILLLFLETWKYFPYCTWHSTITTTYHYLVQNLLREPQNIRKIGNNLLTTSDIIKLYCLCGVMDLSTAKFRKKTSWVFWKTWRQAWFRLASPSCYLNNVSSVSFVPTPEIIYHA